MPRTLDRTACQLAGSAGTSSIRTLNSPQPGNGGSRRSMIAITRFSRASASWDHARVPVPHSIINRPSNSTSWLSRSRSYKNKSAASFSVILQQSRSVFLLTPLTLQSPANSVFPSGIARKIAPNARSPKIAVPCKRWYNSNAGALLRQLSITRAWTVVPSLRRRCSACRTRRTAAGSRPYRRRMALKVSTATPFAEFRFDHRYLTKSSPAC